MNNVTSAAFRANKGTDHLGLWTSLLGVFLVLLGAAVIGASALATIAVSWLVGAALIIGGIAQLTHFHRSAIRLLIAALSIVAGVIILKTPIVAAVAITLILAFYLLVGSVAKAALAFEGPRDSARVWLIFSSAISLFLGCYLLATFPISSLIIPGVLLGIDIMFYGISIALDAQSLRRGYIESEPIRIRRVS